MAAPYQSYPPFVWESKTDGRDSASAGDSFSDSRVTEQSPDMGIRLQGWGFKADPQTAWTAGQVITINDDFEYHWNGGVWVAGALTEPEPEPPEDEPEEVEPDVAPEPEEASESPVEPTEEATE